MSTNEILLNKQTGLLCPHLDLLTTVMLFGQIEAGTRPIIDIGDGEGAIFLSGKFAEGEEDLVLLKDHNGIVLHPGKRSLCICGSGKKYKNCCMGLVIKRPPGRNASCPCGSGRKYKACCMKKQLTTAL